MLTLRPLLMIIIITHHATSESKLNPLRKKDLYTPTITVSYTHSPEEFYSTTDSLFELYPLFHTYNPIYFKQHLLPKGPIKPRYNTEQSFSGTTLSKLVNELLLDVLKNKNKFKHFTILKDQNFNYDTHVGALILKLNNHPFVVKLFIESPKSWICPHQKGIESWCHHVIGGGVSRHLCGFTRIKNREWVYDQVQKNPHYKDIVDLPRKWFWTPHQPTYLQLTGSNIGKHTTIVKEIPAIYAIIEDAIEIERPFSMRKYKDRKTALDLANYLNMRIDAHINNFVYEKTTGKIILIDTELFTVLVGLKKPMLATGFASYYAHLIKKAFLSFFFSSKEDRRKRQETLEPPCGLLD